MSDALPLFPLGTVLFPGMVLPLHIFEPRYRRMVADRIDADPMFGVVLTRLGREVGDEAEHHAIGTAARLASSGRYPDGRYDIVVRGTRRFRAVDGDWSRGYRMAEIEWLPEVDGPGDLEALSAQVGRAHERLLAALERATGGKLPRDPLPDDPADRAWEICARLPLDLRERQRLLERESALERLEDLLAVLRRERELLVNSGVVGLPIVQPGSTFTAN